MNSHDVADRKMEKFTWCNANTESLIDLMSINTVLYDCSNKDYSNRDIRRKICDDIARELQTTGTIGTFCIM